MTDGFTSSRQIEHRCNRMQFCCAMLHAWGFLTDAENKKVRARIEKFDWEKEHQRRVDKKPRKKKVKK